MMLEGSTSTAVRNHDRGGVSPWKVISAKNDNTVVHVKRLEPCPGRCEGQGINTSSIEKDILLISHLVIQPTFESAMGSLRRGFKKAGRRSYDQI